MNKNWVSVKKGNQYISKIPYQAFKDVFEKDGFELVIDENLNDNSILSSLSADKEKGQKTTAGGVKAKAVEKNKDITEEARDDTSGVGKSSNRKRKS